ncbi:MAG: hypothetical protein RLZZ387_3974 [Chloroflexota bacterium]|jgi:hypothetical protein
MSLSGARGLIRVAHNPTCELQAAMVIARVREPDMYRATEVHCASAAAVAEH